MNNTTLKEKAKNLLTKAGVIVTAAWYGNVEVFCDPFSKAETALSSVLTGLVKVGKALFPIAIIIIIISLFITHDERKLQMEIKIGVALCVAYILLLIFSNPDNIITQWLGTLAQ